METPEEELDDIDPADVWGEGDDLDQPDYPSTHDERGNLIHPYAPFKLNVRKPAQDLDELKARMAKDWPT